MAKNTKTLSADVVKLSNEVKKLSDELAKLKKGTLEYNVVSQKLNQKVKESISASNSLREKTDRLSASNRTHTASINAARKAQDELNNALKRASSVQQKGPGFMDKFLGSFTAEKLGSTLGTVTRFLGIGSAVFTAINGIKQITTEAFKTFTRLEQQFASLSAISGATADEMNKVRDSAFEVASSVGYSTSEIIKLQTSLVKLGVPIDDVSKSVKSIAIAAKVMGDDLSSVGETVFRVSNQFGLSSQEISGTSAILVRAVNESALTFQEFGTAIQYVGPVAKQAGLNFSETAGYMQVLSDAGFKASKIGTGLRDIFIDLKQPGETLTQTISRLSKENISLSDAVDLVGKTSASQLLVLMRNAEELEKFSNVTSIVNQLEKDLASLLVQNAKNMDTNSGRINSLAVAWEAYSFRIGRAITLTETYIDLLGLLDSRSEAAARAYKVLSKLTEEQATQFVSSFSSATGPYQRSQIAARALSEDQMAGLRETYSTSGIRQRGATFEEYLTTIATKRTGKAYTDEEQVLLGVYRELAKASKDLEMSEQALNIRRQQYAKFSTEFAAVEAASGNKRLQLADSLRKKLEAEEDRLQEKLKKSANDSEKAKNEIQLQAAKDRSQQLAELTSGEEEKLEEAQKNQDERDKKIKDAQTKEVARLKDLIELRKREYQELIDSLEIEKELALAKGDLNEAARIEALLIKKRSDSYKELTNILTSNKIITAEQRFDLVGTFDNFKVNEKDIKESIERFAKIYKEAISAKGIFQGVQAGDAAVEQLLLSLESSLGNLSESDKQKIRDLINLLVFPDLKKDIKTKDGKDASEEIKKQIEDAINSLSNLTSAFSDGLSELNDVALDNLKNRLDAEKEAIKERADYEQKILESQVENQLITQEEYERKLESVQKRRIQKENQINKKIFEAEKKRDRQNAGLDFVETLANITLNNYKKFDSFTASAASIVAALAATAQYGLKLSAINQRQFVPVRFAEGGVVNGPSHAEGGVPFTVKGRGGYEMEGGEFIVNKEATKRNYSLLRQINDSVKPSKYSVGRKFAAGGMVNAEEISVRQIELLENIAYATGGTYINTGKPVRAFVSSDDLRKSDVDLRVRERNSNL